MSNLKEKLENILPLPDSDVCYCKSEVLVAMQYAYHLGKAENDWIKVISGVSSGSLNVGEDRVVLLFETGETCLYSDKHWPHEIVTHYFIIPEKPTK